MTGSTGQRTKAAQAAFFVSAVGSQEADSRIGSSDRFEHSVGGLLPGWPGAAATAALLAALPARPWFVLLLVLYLLPITLGHEPWKSQDLVHGAVVAHMLANGEWLTPHLAAETGVIRPPLYYWLGAGLATIRPSWLAWYDAARLATTLFVGFHLALLMLTARVLCSQTLASWLALLVGLSCVGLLVPGHEMQPAVAALASSTLMAWAWAALAQERMLVAGSLALGVGGGAALLSAGLPAVLPGFLIAPVLLVLPAWRRRGVALGVLAALAVASLLHAAWWFSVSSQGLDTWWPSVLRGLNAVSRPGNNLLDYLALLLTDTWPVWPLAAWGLWRMRRRAFEPAIALPVSLLAAMLAVQALIVPARALGALPLAMPLSLLAVPGLVSLRRGAANLFHWFAVCTGLLGILMVWLGWVAMTQGWPPAIARNFAKLEPGYTLPLQVGAIVAAVAVTILFLTGLRRIPRSPISGAIHWAVGLSLVWCLIALLWLPWVDQGRNYRKLMAPIGRLVQAQGGCVQGRNLSETHVAGLQVYAGIVIRPRGQGCEWLVSARRLKDGASGTPDGWQLVLETSRSGLGAERFGLYRRVGVALARDAAPNTL